jgi:hypothetical protein
MAAVMYTVLALIVGGFGVIVLVQLWRFDLGGLVCELDGGPGQTRRGGKASISRFQLLLFTFVIAGLYLVLCLEKGDFIEMPASVLGLLGISGGSFVVSKGISSQTGKTPPAGSGGSAGGGGGGGGGDGGGNKE